MMDWMAIPEDEATQGGKLFCPNEKCKAVLGDFAHYGAQCNCGRFTSPAYKVVASKVDRISPSMYNI